MPKFDNSYSRLPSAFFTEIQAAPIAQPVLLAFNEPLARELGFEPELLSSPDLAQYFCGNKNLSGSHPIALAYSGHQFGHFNPRLGDGRALLLGEVITPKGQRFDLQLKGSGPTPYSRSGDGKSALGPVIREYLVSEAMHWLGIPTTRALAAVLTNELVEREQSRAGAIFTRVASSHIRVGTFEHFASRKETSHLQQLLNYTIERHYPELNQSTQPVLDFLNAFAERHLALVAEWMRVGFIHGVMNTDNTAISGETLDFGPCAFMEEYRHDQVFSSIDHQGRYAFNNQGPIACWNIMALTNCLVPLIDSDLKVAIGKAQEFVDSLLPLFEKKWLESMSKKLGLLNVTPTDRELIQDWLKLLEDLKLDFTVAHVDLMNIFASVAQPPQAWQGWLSRWTSRTKDQAPQETKALMSRANPILIPRNHQIEKAIELGYNNDFSHFQRLQRALRSPYENKSEDQDLQTPASSSEKVTRTFCGT